MVWLKKGRRSDRLAAGPVAGCVDAALGEPKTRAPRWGPGVKGQRMTEKTILIKPFLVGARA